MPFELVPPLDRAESAAVHAFLVASGLVPDSAPVAYGTPWRRAAAEEAAGHNDDSHADLGTAARPYRGVESRPRPPARKLG